MSLLRPARSVQPILSHVIASPGTDATASFKMGKMDVMRIEKVRQDSTVRTMTGGRSKRTILLHGSPVSIGSKASRAVLTFSDVDPGGKHAWLDDHAGVVWIYYPETDFNTVSALLMAKGKRLLYFWRSLDQMRFTATLHVWPKG